jgi:hypothetical protein
MILYFNNYLAKKPKKNYDGKSDRKNGTGFDVVNARTGRP